MRYIYIMYAYGVNVGVCSVLLYTGEQAACLERRARERGRLNGTKADMKLVQRAAGMVPSARMHRRSFSLLPSAAAAMFRDDPLLPRIRGSPNTRKLAFIRYSLLSSSRFTFRPYS